MRWKQFFTPVKSFTADQAREFLEGKSADEVDVLDVRQPGEFERGHLPGANLIPLPELTKRFGEINRKKPTVVYCAVGGRSRMAAQLLSGVGFDNMINLHGGYRAWKGDRALGAEDIALYLFTGKESQKEVLLVAYALEVALGDFYMEMKDKVGNPEVKKLFQKLSEIERKHQQRIYDEYREVSNETPDIKSFEEKIVPSVLEGGLTTEEYARIYQPDWESPEDVISLAMSIEAQALDLYLRAAKATHDEASGKRLLRIAEEERTHLKLLGGLMDSVVGD